MYEYGQYCPIAKAVEILGDRWTLLWADFIAAANAGGMVTIDTIPAYEQSFPGWFAHSLAAPVVRARTGATAT